MTGGIAEIQARVAAIETRLLSFSGRGAPIDRTSSSTSGTSLSADASLSPTDFAAALKDATGVSGSTRSTTGDAVVADAKKYLGVPYVWGGTDPATGLDCSGLVQRVYKDLGITLPRVSQDQAKVGTPVASLALAKPGDLLVFHSDASHIAIYAGNGQMVEAPRPGLSVRLTNVNETPTAIRRVIAPPSVTTSSSSAASRYQTLFDSATAKYGLPASLLSAVASIESGYNANARSNAGAVGLMQLMPSTAAGLGVDATNPAQAVDGAARILSSNLKKFGTIPLALAAYNAGAGAVTKYGGVPPFAETQSYVRKVQALMQEMS